jgi:outer membrane murein-binding lipoprotein Lpp
MRDRERIAYAAALAALALMTCANTCSSCRSRGSSKEASRKVDSLITTVRGVEAKVDALPTATDLKVEGLKTEKRTLINCNTVFLTRERPDRRYTAIDAEIDSLESSARRAGNK